MVSLPDGDKNFEDMFIRFDVIHERDGQTDGPVTAWQQRPRLCIASRGKKQKKTYSKTNTSLFALTSEWRVIKTTAALRSEDVQFMQLSRISAPVVICIWFSLAYWSIIKRLTLL